MNIEVTIEPQVFDHNKYLNPWDCYLADALKKMGYKDVSVGTDIRIEDRGYYLPEGFGASLLKKNFANNIPTTLTLIEAT